MIFASHPWRVALRRWTRELRRRTSQTRWTSGSDAKIEQMLLLGFYTVRKLGEAKKISDATIGQQIRVKRYVAAGEPVTRMNWDKIDRLYRLRKPSWTTITLQKLCHQFIHSFVLVFAENGRGGLGGVYVVSDRDRNRQLYYLSAKQIITLLERVADDNPTYGTSVWDPKMQDYVVRVGHEPVGVDASY